MTSFNPLFIGARLLMRAVAVDKELEFSFNPLFIGARLLIPVGMGWMHFQSEFQSPIHRG